MDRKIPWNTIINGCNGFEELALEFVKSEYSQYNWQGTKQTRDGNKDAEAVVVFCYNDSNDNPKVWMEAKYSTQCKKISRYKLDSTIVSAILDQKVKRIFFVTNIEIKPNTRTAIIKALRNGLGIKNDDAIFCTCQELEIWLLRNPEQFDKFFKGQHFPKGLLDDIALIDNPSFYSAINDDLVYNEPFETLFVDEKYNLCFSLYSPDEYFTRIISKDKYFKISNVKYLLGQERISYIKLNVRALKKGRNPILTLALERSQKTIDIPLKIAITENKYSRVKILLTENEKTKTKILQDIQTFLKPEEHFSQIINLFGPSATGKSHLIKEIFNEDLFTGQNVIYTSFNYDQDSNVERLLNLMIRFYFHLWESIDDIDTNKLHRNIPDIIKEYVERHKNKQLTASDFAKMADEEREVCFQATQLNKRIIVIEDAHKLDRSLRNVLSKVLRDLATSKTNILGLIVGQEDFSYFTNYPQTICSRYELYLTQESFFKCLDENGIKYNPEHTLLSISDKLSLDDRINIFFIKDFISYIKSNNKTNSELDVTDILNQYVYSDKFRNSVLENIKTATFENGKQILNNLLHVIFFSLSGINPDQLREEHRKLIDKLIAYQLVKKDESNRLVPVHDIYCDLFRDEFDRQHNNLFDIYEDKLYSTDEKMRYLVSQNMMNPADLLNHTENLIKSHQYYIVLYILAVIFKDFQKADTDISSLPSKTGGKIRYEYYKLFYFYIYALGHNSRTFRAYNRMKQLEEHLRQKRQEFSLTNFMSLRANILGELINSAFETLETDNVLKYSDEIINLFKQIKEDNPDYDYTHNGAYILMKEIGVLTAQLLDNNDFATKQYNSIINHCNDIDYTVKCAIIRVRYARGLYASDLNKAWDILNEADDYLKKCGDIKWKQIKDFEASYVGVLLKKSCIDNLKSNLYKLKFNLYNDYRRGLRSVCAYYLSVKRMDCFDIFFKEYISSPRPMNDRDRGLMHHLLGLKYFIINEYSKALRELEQQSILFQNAGKSYKFLIEHNVKVAKTCLTAPPTNSMVKFHLQDNALEDNIMYIEPRLW